MAEPIGGVAAFTGLVDLAGEAVGGRVLGCSDEWFADAAHLVKRGPAHFDPTTYGERGKIMDGWESRRRRTPGHDWAILELGVPGRVRVVDIDTAHFLGNHAPVASVDATVAEPGTSLEFLRDEASWTRIVPETPLRRGAQNLCASVSGERWTHVRLNIYPDGGVARLRVHGDPEPTVADGRIDLASVLNGGRTLAASDAFFSPMEQLIEPGRSQFMGGGWETRRSRPRGADWILVKLGRPGVIERIEADTDHFKGNFPDEVAIDAIHWPDAPTTTLRDSPDWERIVPLTKMAADRTFGWEPTNAGPWTHLRLWVIPDGGVARLRAFGRPTTTTPADGEAALKRLSAVAPEAAAETLRRCCGSERWVKGMVAARPFTSRAHLFGAAESVWWHLDEADWREAFTHHPRIGADVAALREKFAATAEWSAGEQAAVSEASEETLKDLARGNRAYEERFGFLFIVCATGQSAEQMLAALERRMPNPPANEVRIAAGEQAKITRIRLGKLLDAG